MNESVEVPKLEDAMSSTNVIELYSDNNQLLLEQLLEHVKDIKGIVCYIEFKDNGNSVLVSNRNSKDLAFAAMAVQDAFQQSLYKA